MLHCVSLHLAESAGWIPTNMPIIRRCPLTGACPVRIATAIFSWCLPNLSRSPALFLHGLPIKSLPCLQPGMIFQVLKYWYSVQLLIASLARHLGKWHHTNRCQCQPRFERFQKHNWVRTTGQRNLYVLQNIKKKCSQDRNDTMLGSRRYLWGVSQYSVGRLVLQRATRNRWLGNSRR
jgi:hypothetical protein